MQLCEVREGAARGRLPQRTVGGNSRVPGQRWMDRPLGPGTPSHRRVVRAVQVRQGRARRVEHDELKHGVFFPFTSSKDSGKEAHEGGRK